MKYLNNVALIFGGTSSVGSSLAVDLALQGAIVIIHYNNSEEKAKDLLKKCNTIYKQLRLKQEAHIVKANARNKNEIKSAIEETVKKYKKINFVINIFSTPFDPVIWNEEDPKAVEKWYYHSFELDVMGTKNSMEFSFPYLKKTKGSIINFSSAPVISGYSEGTAYSVTKAGVKQLTMDYSLKYGPYGIKINAIAPGWIPKGNEKPEELEKALVSTPLRQLGKPEYVAEVVCDILGWRHVTGQTFIVDGGETLR